VEIKNRIFYFYFWYGAGEWAQGLENDRQVLY
jgi:hypothetical protein